MIGWVHAGLSWSRLASAGRDICLESRWRNWLLNGSCQSAFTHRNRKTNQRERPIDQRSAAASVAHHFKRLFPHPLCERLRACVIVESFPCSWPSWFPCTQTHKIVSPDHLSHPPPKDLNFFVASIFIRLIASISLKTYQCWCKQSSVRRLVIIRMKRYCEGEKPLGVTGSTFSVFSFLGRSSLWGVDFVWWADLFFQKGRYCPLPLHRVIPIVILLLNYSQIEKWKNYSKHKLHMDQNRLHVASMHQ